MIKVSVIIPVYNTEEYVEACLDSVLNQSLSDIEIVLVDDGSTDNSHIILERYERDNPDKVRLFTKENGGQATARNVAIPMCRGEYIGFVDSDDVIDSRMYETMYLKAKAKDADYVECDYANVKINRNGKTEKIADYGSRVREYSCKKDMFIDPMLAPWNKIYKRELLQNSGVLFPEGLIYEDTAFCLKAISFVEKYAFVPEKFVSHFYRGGSTMSINKSKRVGNIFEVLNDVIEFYNSRNLFLEYREELEYEITKILLCSSLKRVSKVKDRKLRRCFCEDTWEMIQSNFPKYKNNKYVRLGGKKNFYMRCVNKKNINLFCNIFRLIKEDY